MTETLYNELMQELVEMDALLIMTMMIRVATTAVAGRAMRD
jgi:hypothetical protein